MTPTTVRVALVEGEKADGVLMEQDVFDVPAIDGSEHSSPSDQVTAVILGTQEGALAAGHHLASTGVAWSDETDANALREALVARGLDDVLLVSELHAAAALAQAVGRTLSYNKTAFLFVDSDTATLAVIDCVDGSVPKILSQNPYRADVIATLTEMVSGLEAEEPQPQGMFVVGSDVDVTSVKEHLTNVLSLPVIASEEPQLALARGAALASANAPRFDTSTIGLAYSQDPGETVVHPMALAYGTTAMLNYDDGSRDADIGADSDHAPERSKPFLLAGSMLAVFTAGVTALAIAMGVSIQPAVDQGPGEIATHPNELAPPPTIASAQPAEPKQAPTPPSAAIETARLVVPPAPPPRRVLVGDAVPAPAAPPPPAPVVAPPVIPPPPRVELPVPGLPPIVVQFLPRPPQFEAPRPPWRSGGKGHGKGRGRD
jgi:hypothetical protein